MSFPKLKLLLLCVFLTACEEHRLYSNLEEHTANKMIALLDMAGLPVEKKEEKGNKFTIITSKEAVGRAITLLEANGLPERDYDTFEDIFDDDVLIPSPLAEHAKLNRMLSQAMSSTLANIDGVVLARVHLTIPKQVRNSREVAASSASVFIKHRPEVKMDSSRAKIKALVVDGFENLKYEDVTVMFFPEKPLFVPEALKPVQLKPKNPMYLVKMQVLNFGSIAIMGLLMLLGAFGWFLYPKFYAGIRKPVKAKLQNKIDGASGL